ncbi:hypothetical protein SDC9_123518 [bioreactor metagenome]|uniref:Uncharacterized protein n=1 Tax=bioreactor metagenome TaxID=1076179 RepID=A0A645CHV5_9ZZZZ
MRAGHKQPLHKVFLMRTLTHYAASAAVLRAVGVGCEALDIAKVSHGDRHVLFLNHVVEIDIVDHLRDFGAALIVVFFLDGERFFLDDAEELAFVVQNALQITHTLTEHAIFFHDLVAFESCQTLDAHVENRLRLPLGEAKAIDELQFRFRRACARLDEIYDLVDIIQRDDKAFENMQALFRAVEVIGCAAGDDVFLVLQIIVQYVP